MNTSNLAIGTLLWSRNEEDLAKGFSHAFIIERKTGESTGLLIYRIYFPVNKYSSYVYADVLDRDFIIYE